MVGRKTKHQLEAELATARERIATLEAQLAAAAALPEVDSPEAVAAQRRFTESGFPAGDPLEGEVRTREITSSKEVEADLRRSNAELEQFAYVASHDLQEPLRAVAGMMQLLQKRYQGQLDERADEYIGLAVEAANRMQTLITDLLAYSRVGWHGNPPSATNLAECLNAATANLTVAIGESGAQISCDPLPVVAADAGQLTQVFQNLVGNAIKFRSEQPPRIHVSAVQRDDAWEFTVCDNGIGIESQYFERIFRVFQRLHTRGEYAGNGIGLALCKKIVDYHGGRIWAESEPDRGSTFHFTLPARRSA